MAIVARPQTRVQCYMRDQLIMVFEDCRVPGGGSRPQKQSLLYEGREVQRLASNPFSSLSPWGPEVASESATPRSSRGGPNQASPISYGLQRKL